MPFIHVTWQLLSGFQRNKEVIGRRLLKPDQCMSNSKQQKRVDRPGVVVVDGVSVL